MRLLLALVASLLISGCSSTWMAGRNYGPNDNVWKLGYSETQIGPDVWRVTFTGHQITNAQATDYAMLRAAEVVAAAGFTHFVILGQDGGTQQSAGVALPTASGSALLVNTSRPESTLTVRGTRMADSNALDAAFVARSFRAKYNIVAAK